MVAERLDQEAKLVGEVEGLLERKSKEVRRPP